MSIPSNFFGLSTLKTPHNMQSMLRNLQRHRKRAVDQPIGFPTAPIPFICYCAAEVGERVLIDIHMTRKAKMMTNPK